MNPSPSDDLPAGERDLIEIAQAVGLIGPGDRLPPALLEFSLELVGACARIGDGYWCDDASAGQHIRAVFYP
ncbi:hypothetical protein RCH27_08380 [Paracidovorax citrulli]|uniref:hypothetical protein n=1 Tax=Paracidovorax citrulli TaxID=80869 RepID=UPI003A7F821D